MAFPTIKMGTGSSIPGTPQAQLQNAIMGLAVRARMSRRTPVSLRGRPEERVYRTVQNGRRLFRHAALTRETTMTDATIRNAGLKQMLCERRREMKDDVQSRIRHGRA